MGSIIKTYDQDYNDDIVNINAKFNVSVTVKVIFLLTIIT